MHLAAASNQVPILKYLHTPGLGADLSAMDQHGHTAALLECGCRLQHQELLWRDGRYISMPMWPSRRDEVFPRLRGRGPQRHG